MVNNNNREATVKRQVKLVRERDPLPTNCMLGCSYGCVSLVMTKKCLILWVSQPLIKSKSTLVRSARQNFVIQQKYILFSASLSMLFNAFNAFVNSYFNLNIFIIPLHFTSVLFVTQVFGSEITVRLKQYQRISCRTKRLL